VECLDARCADDRVVHRELTDGRTRDDRCWIGNGWPRNSLIAGRIVGRLRRRGPDGRIDMTARRSTAGDGTPLVGLARPDGSRSARPGSIAGDADRQVLGSPAWRYAATSYARAVSKRVSSLGAEHRWVEQALHADRRQSRANALRPLCRCVHTDPAVLLDGVRRVYQVTRLRRLSRHVAIPVFKQVFNASDCRKIRKFRIKIPREAC
jgi:hypothetical protein